ncbi:S49 family peptidase [Sagittula stellata]|uniref:Probable bacteriophage-related protein n=1 Tax=Sagittula stellata (strain ATCC 700073 / DSM 11524 / E-37) TaxID=388399 RepID=A3K013_SAGS3|nr:S49 family peptidase [Sagittula stellata]EBA09128.1 probable bacteriophage-related protein [Sagittula stellata E-37]
MSRACQLPNPPFVVKSGGGLVDGCFELNDKIYARRGEKPIRAFADSYAYIAAYATASVADSITVTRSGGVGSIGVIITHVEYSCALDTRGVTVTPIRSKPRKAESGPYQALSKAAQAKMQASVDFSHSEFVALVARNRGMSEADVDATDALTFLAHEAVENGLADQIGSTDDALAAFAASFNDPDTGEEPMADKNVADTLPLADHEAAVAAARVEAETAGKAAGADAERARVAAILDSAEAKERPAAARMMVDRGVAADQALVQLAKLPVEAATQTPTGTPTGAGAPAGMLEAAMDGTPQPKVGASDDSENDVDPKEARRAARAKAAREYCLAGFKKPQD